jgi:hypothetical protein
VAAPVVAGVYHLPVAGVSAGTTTQKSTNWSGYASTATAKLTDVVASWTEPTVACTTGSQYSSFWVGIDGYTSNSVEQLGTDSDCHNGSASYYAWYEMYPAGSVQLSSTHRVKPGDSLTARVSASGSSYTLSISDTTAGWTFSTVKTGSGLQQSSAEWIAESPEICFTTCKLASLAKFGTVDFSGAQAAAGGSDQPVSAFTKGGGPFELVMTNSAKTLVRAQPSSLTSGGESFAVAWKHA